MKQETITIDEQMTMATQRLYLIKDAMQDLMNKYASTTLSTTQQGWVNRQLEKAEEEQRDGILALCCALLCGAFFVWWALS